MTWLCLLCSPVPCSLFSFFFFFNHTATTEIYTLSLHDALPIYPHDHHHLVGIARAAVHGASCPRHRGGRAGTIDRKSTRLNSSHTVISYAVFCLKKKKQNVALDPYRDIDN